MPASRADLMARFSALGIATETREHPPVFTVDEAQALRGQIPGGHCKNLFLKDEKGAVWLIVCLEDARIDLKAAPARIGSRRLSFGKPDLLMELLGVEPGSVTPFGLINDVGNRITVILEERMMQEALLNYHPLGNDATTTIKTPDLVAFIRSCGHEPRIVALAA
ncbi:prolyl-tRNA synthetase associated domain-containing protein [Taklimakanibacter lacteus]|uniref:prolyl-tRNA synthetase associated domain-containing protein n=1 Tax=Taklimakanibacter lacteus TaxID=2268456 RepID=UPI000E670F2B